MGPRQAKADRPRSDKRAPGAKALAALALRAMPEAVLVADGDGRIVVANDAAHALLGYEGRDLVGRRVEKLVPEELRDLHRAHREAFVADHPTGGHRAGRLLQARRRDGEVVPVDVTIASLPSDDGPLALALLRDLGDPTAAGRQVGELAALYAFLARALSAILHAGSGAEALDAVCDVAIDRGGFSLAWVGTVDGDALRPATVSGPAARHLDDAGIAIDSDRPMARAVVLGKTVVVPDLGLEPGFVLRSGAPADGFGSLCALPLAVRDETAAVLCLVSPTVSGFTDDALTVLEWLAAELGGALDRPTPEPPVGPPPAVRPEPGPTSADEAASETEAEAAAEAGAASEPETGPAPRPDLGEVLHLATLAASADDPADVAARAGELSRLLADGGRDDLLPDVEALVEVAAERARHRDAGQSPLADPVTTLPNRALLRDRLDQTLAHFSAGNSQVGVLLVHLDGFEALVDEHGEEAGDQLLVAVAERLQRAVDPHDVVGRLRADEFAVVHVTDGGVDDVSDLADRVRVALAPAIPAGEVALRLSASIGVTLHRAGEVSADEMFREAGTAVERAATGGPGRTELYDQDLRRQARRRIDQATALRRAIAEEELVVAWQATLPLQQARAWADAQVWAEALVRWRNPERGVVSPGNFIDLAEETGLIVPVGGVVLRKACAQLAEWRRAGGVHPSRVSVNLSPRQLAQDDLVEDVATAIADAGVDPGSVIFEITEAALDAGPDDAIRRLNALREVGVELAMDDFGTGNSSLGNLRRLPVSVLKIDQTFIRGLTTHRADWAIVRGLVEMGHAIGLTVVAEGIETREQRDQLVSLGCDRGQGYFWSSPVPAEDLERMLADWFGRAGG